MASSDDEEEKISEKYVPEESIKIKPVVVENKIERNNRIKNNESKVIIKETKDTEHKIIRPIASKVPHQSSSSPSKSSLQSMSLSYSNNVTETGSVSVKIQSSYPSNKLSNSTSKVVEEERQVKQMNLLVNINGEENLIKRPLDIVRQTSSNNLLKQPPKYQFGDGMFKYKMMPAANGQDGQNESKMNAFNYPNYDYSEQMNYNRIFPEG